MSRRKKSKSNYHRGAKNEECYFCGSGPPLREHHVIPQRFGGPDSRDNIVELCDLCHKRLERLYDKSFYEWFGIKDETGQRKFHRQCESEGCTNLAKVEIEQFEERYHEAARYRVASDWYWRESLEANWDNYTTDLHRYEDGMIGSGLYCRPCVAKHARVLHHIIWTNYRESMEKLHKAARREYKSNKRKSHRSKNIGFRTRPECETVEDILKEIIVEESDDGDHRLLNNT